MSVHHQVKKKLGMTGISCLLNILRLFPTVSADARNVAVFQRFTCMFDRSRAKTVFLMSNIFLMSIVFPEELII